MKIYIHTQPYHTIWPTASWSVFTVTPKIRMLGKPSSKMVIIRAVCLVLKCFFFFREVFILSSYFSPLRTVRACGFILYINFYESACFHFVSFRFAVYRYPSFRPFSIFDILIKHLKNQTFKKWNNQNCTFSLVFWKFDQISKLSNLKTIFRNLRYFNYLVKISKF